MKTITVTDSKRLARVLSRVAAAVSKDDTRSAFSHLHLCLREDGRAVYAVGTDGHRMHAASVGIVAPLLEGWAAWSRGGDAPAGWHHFPIARGSIADVRSQLRDYAERGRPATFERVDYVCTPRREGAPAAIPAVLVSTTHGSVHHYLAAPDVELYNHLHLVPRTSNTELVLPYTVLKDAIEKRGGWEPGMSNADIDPPAGRAPYLRFRDATDPAPLLAPPAGWLTVLVNGELVPGASERPVRALDVTLHGPYALDAIRADALAPQRRRECRIGLSAPLDPVVFRDDNAWDITTDTGESFVAVVMPLRP